MYTNMNASFSFPDKKKKKILQPLFDSPLHEYEILFTSLI